MKTNVSTSSTAVGNMQALYDWIQTWQKYTLNQKRTNSNQNDSNETTEVKKRSRN